MKVLLVEELAGRERLALLALESALEERGHEVRLSNSWRLERDYRSFRPDVIADNISDSVAHYLGKLAAAPRRSRNVNLIWEQLANPVNLRRYRFDPLLQRGLVDGRIAWGKAFHDLLLLQNPDIEPERVRATGSIKHGLHDLYRSLPRRGTADLLGIDADAYEHIVVFADSFQVALQDVEPLRLALPKHNRSPPFLYEYVRWLQQARDETLRLVLGLADRNPRSLFIVRIHPTKSDAYRRHYGALASRKNVVVNSSGDFTALLHLADLLIACRSGSLVDAHFMGRPAVNVRLPGHPLDATHLTWALENQFGRGLTPDEALAIGLEGLLGQSRPTKAQQDLAAHWFGPMDGRCYERAALFLEETAQAPRVPRRLPPSGWLLRRGAFEHPLPRRVRNHVRTWGGLTGNPPDDRFPYRELFERLTGEPAPVSAARARA